MAAAGKALYSSKPEVSLSRCCFKTSLQRMRRCIADDGHGFCGISLAYNAFAIRQDGRRSASPKGPHGRAKDCFKAGPCRCSGAAIRGTSADPDGFPWEVAWNPFFRLEEDGSTGDPRRLLPQPGDDAAAADRELRVRGADVLVERSDWSQPASWQGEVIFCNRSGEIVSRAAYDNLVTRTREEVRCFC